MDKLQLIKAPIMKEFGAFKALFDSSLQSSDPLLNEVLIHIKQRNGKMLRPILTLLVAKGLGDVTETVFHASISLELLHTASLLHDDVVDESDERRGQPSVNAVYDNKISVLVGDYILSNSLKHAALTNSTQIVDVIARLGQNLAEGEIIQLTNVQSTSFDEKVYFDVIRKKTAALFSSCAAVGAISTGAPEEKVGKVYNFGELVGLAFQIKDDIFDYYPSPEIGKPTENDMHEGKLTLPALYVINHTEDASVREIALRIRSLKASAGEISHFVDIVKSNGGIDYANKIMHEYRDRAVGMLKEMVSDDICETLTAYIDFVVDREK